MQMGSTVSPHRSRRTPLLVFIKLTMAVCTDPRLLDVRGAVKKSFRRYSCRTEVTDGLMNELPNEEDEETEPLEMSMKSPR